MLEVFESAILREIHSVILIHNHVSGDPNPSNGDYEVTKQMGIATDTLSIDLMDHVIISKKSCTSAITRAYSAIIKNGQRNFFVERLNEILFIFDEYDAFCTDHECS